MMTETILLDTNVLLRALVVDSLEHPQVRSALFYCVQNGIQIVVCPQNISEMWSVLTRPVEANGYGLTTQETAQKVHQILESFPMLIEPPTLVETLIDLCVRYDVKGKQVHDARLVALMKVAGVRTLLTLDKQVYERFHEEISCIHPSELIAID